MDAQGAEVARPYVDKANAEYVTVVDEENLLGQLYGFKAIPNGFLIDEQGTVVYKELGGFNIREAKTAAMVGEWGRSGRIKPPTPASDGDLGREHSKANSLFRKGLALYREGKVDEAMAEWRKGVDLEPDNYIIRKQIWAVQNPEKFYEGKVDYDWQDEQLAKGL